MATEHQAQINNAVLAALSPGPLQSQAFEFLQSVKASAADTWEIGLACFLAGQPETDGKWRYTFGGETRLFGLQVLDIALIPSSDDPKEEQVIFQRCETAKAHFLGYLVREFVDGVGEEHSYLRNKLVQTLFILFMQLYASTWADFFSFFASLLRKHPTGASWVPDGAIPLNPRATDLLLRLLHEVSVEISDTDLRLNKAYWRLDKDSKLRDTVRARDAGGIAQHTFAIVAEALQGLEAPEGDMRIGLAGKRAQECLEMGVRVVADFVGWIDITLIVTPTWVPFLYQALRLPHLPVRLAAADALISIVTKGMPPANRLELYEILGLVNVLGALVAGRQSKGKAVQTDEDEGIFAERLARILNGMGVELSKVCEEASASEEVRRAAHQSSVALHPLLLAFLEDSYWPVDAAVLAFVSVTLSRYKKEKKASPASHLTEEKRVFLTKVLETVILKMQFPADDDAEAFDWEPPTSSGEQIDEDAAAFAERRKNLKLIFDAIAWVDEEMFKGVANNLIKSALGEMGAGAEISWQRAELAMWVLFLYGDAIKGSSAWGPGSFVLISGEEKKKASKNREYKIEYTAWPLSQLGELMLCCCQSEALTRFPHSSVPLQWFECVVRYHDFFTIRPDAVMLVLPAFMDHRGLHQGSQSVRARCFYLFYRFISQGKQYLQSHSTGDLVQGILERMNDLVQIQVELVSADAGIGMFTKAAASPSFFDNQLYLFETIGILIAILDQDSARQASLLRAVLAPLLDRLQQNVRAQAVDADNFTAVIFAQRYILAAAAVMKGFPDLGQSQQNPAGEWGQVFREATDGILEATKELSRFQIIRDGARSAFNKIIGKLGAEALPHVPVLLDCLVPQLTATELVDFFGFVGQLIHKYKDRFAPLLDDFLVLLFTRVFGCLEQPITGTDDVVQQSELRRAYFNLLNSIVAGNLQGVFLSTRNKPHFKTILDSLPHYLGSSATLVPDIRAGFAVINRLSLLWVNTTSGVPMGSKPVNDSPIPGFEQYLYEKIIPLCFEIPSRITFSWGDAQSFQVLQEMSTLIKNLMTIRGPEFAQFMLETLLPSIGCPAEPAQALVEAFRTSPDGKQSRKPLVDFFAHARSTWRLAK